MARPLRCVPECLALKSQVRRRTARNERILSRTLAMELETFAKPHHRHPDQCREESEEDQQRDRSLDPFDQTAVRLDPARPPVLLLFTIVLGSAQFFPARFRLPGVDCVNRSG